MNFLEKLVNANGVCGSEEEIRGLIEKEISQHVNKTYIDKMGNLVAIKKGDKPRVMLAAHMDEVGLMAKSILETGEIFFSPLGAVKPDSMIGQKALVRGSKSTVMGIITSKIVRNGWDIVGEREPHTIHNLFIDTGLTKKELEGEGVTVGSAVSFVQESGYLANRKYFFGKALDDRIGCYVLVELAKKLKRTRNEIDFVFTVQEEMGLYGAKTAAFELSPDWAIAVDTINANDCFNEKATKRLGYGPSITVKDADMLANKCIIGWLLDIAKKKKIQTQLDVSDSGTTDALTISLSREGVPSAVVGIAVRNQHSTVAMASVRDIESAIELLSELLQNPPKVCLV